MLKNLKIENYALIDSLNLEFDEGLTIITGETGAGKSVILGALGLVMGGRAMTRVIADSSRKSIVEAEFVAVPESLRTLFEERGIDWIDDAGESVIIIRRELSAAGKSKIFVNNCAATSQTLSQIACRLIDIHSQHANAEINDPAVRISIMDSFAGNAELLEEYRRLYHEYSELHKRLKICREQRGKALENMDVLKFHKANLDKLRPVRGELAEIERRYEMLSDADEIRERLSYVNMLLGGGDNGVVSLLGNAGALIEKIDNRVFGSTVGDTDPGAESLAGRLGNILVEVKDISATVEDALQQVDTDPATLKRLSDRMNLYYEMIKNFRVKDADELVTKYENISSQISALETENDEIPRLEKEGRVLARMLKTKAEALTESRVRAAEEFSRRLVSAAMPLGLPNLKFRVCVTPRKLTGNGQDDVEFLCAFNKNGALNRLKDVASGGEISRLMLSMKAIMAGCMQLPTVIFDEVDTGVSGEIADRMGMLMKDISSRMQVIAITHLPQVAAKGKNHYKVFKRDEGDRTKTSVTRLTTRERIEEIAGMISGNVLTDAARGVAAALLEDV
ncbi:MAG: DNA repair protein RecN [Candidatus Amulumruptor caecigallinarius]|nr:DNA repair protein RecN [Candidatus Amulumruptor caecigallinarius]